MKHSMICTRESNSFWSMLKNGRTGLIMMMLFLSSFISGGQNLTSIGKSNPLSISGGISFNQIAYGALGLKSRREPYSYVASGNLNLSLYGWSVPVSYTFSNRQGSFSQPFNRYSLHPTYKNVTAHLGNTSMSFSPYTLSGHLFLGAGIEISKEKLKSATMFGRLLKAVEPDSLNSSSASYTRWGYGAKVSYNHKSTTADFIVFRGKDDPRSITFAKVDSVTKKPEENLVLSLGLGHQFFKRLSVKAEIAISGVTEDTRASGQALNSFSFFEKLGPLFTVNSSTNFFKAYKMSSSYGGNGFTVGVAYERVDPGYRTHGAYYFVNDVENLTLNGSKVLLGGKINVSASGGVQRDNLDGEKVSTLRRFVGSALVGYTPTTRLSISSTYSSFQSFTNIRSQFVGINQLTPYDNLDTLNFRQVSQSISMGVNYVISSSESKRQNAGVNLSYQGSKDQRAGKEQGGGSNFYMFSGSYSLGLVPQKINISGTFNYNNSAAGEVRSETMGPSLSITKSLRDNKMNLSAGLSWNQSRTNGKSQGSVTSLRLGGRYALRKKHNLNVNIAAVNRSQPVRESTPSRPRNFTEITATVGYSYSFSKDNFFNKKK